MSNPAPQSGLILRLRRLADRFRRSVTHPAADILLAQSCALCQLPSGSAPICAACAAELPALPAERCGRCALPATAGLTHCSDCTRRTPEFDKAYAVWAYDFPVDTLVRDFKYGHHLYLGSFFASQLAQVLEAEWTVSGHSRPDLIVPMPLHPNRLRSRGFNQAAEIARHLSRKLDIPCAYDALIRLHDTPPQAGLHRDERWHNLVGAFGCPKPLAACRILLVDDVLTTGASLSACAAALREAGATRIEVAVVARTRAPDTQTARN